MLMEMWSNWNSHMLLVEMPIGTAALENDGLWYVIYVYLPYDSEIQLLGIYPKQMRTYVHTKTQMCMFIAASFIITSNRKQLERPLTGKLNSDAFKR